MAGPPLACVAGLPVTTSVQGVVLVPSLMPKVHVQVVLAASQVRDRLVMVHCSAVAIMETESARLCMGTARAVAERRAERIRFFANIFADEERWVGN